MGGWVQGGVREAGDGRDANEGKDVSEGKKKSQVKAHGVKERSCEGNSELFWGKSLVERWSWGPWGIDESSVGLLRAFLGMK